MKRSKQTKSMIGALIAASLLVSSPVFAHAGFGPGRMGMVGARTHLLEELQLTPDQRARVENIFANGRETIRTLHQQLWEKQTALRETARTQPFDEARVRSQAQEAADLQAQLIVARAQLMNQARGVLTEDQKTKLSQLLAERLQRFREWRQQHMGRPEQPKS